jgi:stage V sporulation protein SpoVS
MKTRERLRVKSTTAPQDLAGAIAKYITVDKKDIEIVGIGAGAVCQAVKGLILARRFVSSHGIDLAITPAFETLDIDGKEVTAIKFLVDER